MHLRLILPSFPIFGARVRLLPFPQRLRPDFVYFLGIFFRGVFVLVGLLSERLKIHDVFQKEKKQIICYYCSLSLCANRLLLSVLYGGANILYVTVLSIRTSSHASASHFTIFSHFWSKGTSFTFSATLAA
jgi:hypothetical protein